MQSNAKRSLSTGVSREAPVDSESFASLCFALPQSNAKHSLSTGASREVPVDNESLRCFKCAFNAKRSIPASLCLKCAAEKRCLLFPGMAVAFRLGAQVCKPLVCILYRIAILCQAVCMSVCRYGMLSCGSSYSFRGSVRIPAVRVSHAPSS